MIDFFQYADTPDLSKCIAVRFGNDAFAPTYSPNDWVWVDPADKRFSDGLCAFERDDSLEPVIYRTQHTFDGRLRLFSDNPAYKETSICIEKARLLMMGRVVGIFKHY